ncbi:MAG TPA: FkbM family methyltransferase [Anaerolineales bacterium]|nr:FkbM family methyltransferase [Anaerolineales bacterium]
MASRPTSRLMAAAAWLAGWLPPAGLRALYGLGPISGLLRSLLNRSAPQGTSEVTVAGGRLAGARLLLDLREEKDLWLGSYEPFVLETIARFARPGMTAYDVGAHIGYVTLCLARAVGPQGHVVAFEPLPANQQRLRTNLELNGLSGRVQVVAGAVGEAAGWQLFRPHLSVAMGKLTADAPDEPAAGLLEVEVIALDEFSAAAGTSPGLIKMDIEGGEAAALRGARRLMRQAKPVLLLELHEAQAAEAGTVFDELQQMGYEVRRLARQHPVVTSTAELGRKAYLLGLPSGEFPVTEGE